MNQSKYFEGVKVIELANVLAGPAVGLFFAELGAEVIKVENKNTGGDMTRKWKLQSEDPDSPISAYYSSVNWNKTVHLLDLKTDEDQAFVHDLIKEADIVISNFKFGKAVDFNMDYESLKTINPSLIYGHISGYGDDSPRTAFDVVLQAETGYMSMNGQSDSPPTKMPIAFIDILAAHQMKEGLLLALIRKMKSGEGSYLSVSLHDSAIASLANQATNWLMAGHNPQRQGSLHPNIAPYGEMLKTQDGKFIVLAVGTDKHFKSLCSCLENPQLALKEKFSTNEKRVKNRTELIEILQHSMPNLNSENIIKKLHSSGVPCGVINTLADIFSNQQLDHLLHAEDSNGIRTTRVKTIAFKCT